MARIFAWMLLLNTAEDSGELVGGLRRAYSRPQPAKTEDEMDSAILKITLARIWSEGKPHIQFVVGKLESCGHHADDFVALAIKLNSLSRQLLVAKIPLPKTMTYNHDPVSARLFILSKKRSPLSGRSSQQRKEICRNPHRHDT